MNKSARGRGLWRRQGIVALIIAACVGSQGVLASERVPGQVLCGLGPPPGSLDFAAFNARQAAEEKRQGFVWVCEANLERFNVPSPLRPIAEVMPKLAFKPVDLASTPFSRLTPIGAAAERHASPEAYNRLYRSFRTPRGHTVTLSENDMSVVGMQMFRDPKSAPERINGQPAVLRVFQTPTGTAVSVVFWEEGRRSYELWTNSNIALEHSREELLALASSLPKSVPARKSEPGLQPFLGLGPDGRPLDAPPPQTLRIDDAPPLPSRY